MIPQSIIQRAAIQSTTFGVKVNIYQLDQSTTIVIAPAGYNIPKEATLLGSVDKDGNFTDSNNDSIPERNQGEV